MGGRTAGKSRGAGARTPADMMAAVTDRMRARTGRSLDEWVAVVLASGHDPRDQKRVRQWLKDAHGVLQNSQWAIAEASARAVGWAPPDLDGYIAQQYTGPKAALRPIFDRLRTVLESLGQDVVVDGRGTYIPFGRRRQFAAVAAATRTRVDVGLRYRNPPVSTRLVPADAPGQATHKLSLESAADVTAEVRRLLRAAYDQNG